ASHELLRHAVRRPDSRHSATSGRKHLAARAPASAPTGGRRRTPRPARVPHRTASARRPWRPDRQQVAGDARTVRRGPERRLERGAIMAEGGIEVTNDEATQRYETRVDGAVALIQYERRGDRIVFLHTEVPAALEGHGVGSALARAALDDARARHLTVV